MSYHTRHIIEFIFGKILIGGFMELNKRNSDYYYIVARINIKKYRLQAKMTAQQLADASGYTHQYIRDLESLKLVRRPRVDTLGRIAEALKIDFRQLFDDVD